MGDISHATEKFSAFSLLLPLQGIVIEVYSYVYRSDTGQTVYSVSTL